MEQKMKWIGYLQLGISLVFVLLLSSCKKDNHFIKTQKDFRYINETNHEIYIYTPYEESITVQPLDTGFFYYSGYQSVHVPNIAVLKYDDVKCDTLSSNETVLNKLNYEVEKLSDSYYQYTYRFTEADYERVIDCE